MTQEESDCEVEMTPLARRRTPNLAPREMMMISKMIARTKKGSIWCWMAAFAGLVVFIIFWYCKSQEYMTPTRIAHWSTNKTIVITGANSVVASGALVHLIRANTANHIIMACRHPKRCQQTLEQVQREAGQVVQSTQQLQQQEQQQKNTVFSTVALDLNDPLSIQECASSVLAITEQQEPQQKGGGGATNATATAAASPENQKKKKNLILVWNAHDYIHDPIRVNGWGHLYLTHLLYSEIQRVVVAVSIVGGVPWNVLQPWNVSSPHYPTWFQPVARYGTSKRAILFLAQQLLEGQYHRRQHQEEEAENNEQQQEQQPLQVVATQAGLTCDETDDCSVVSMTPQKGGYSHLRSMLDPNLLPGSYVGHRWVLWGKTIVAGTLDASWYHMQLSEQTRIALWHWSLQELGIQDFGAI